MDDARGSGQQPSDDPLIAELEATLAEERRRGPMDLLVVLCWLLIATSIVLTIAAAIVGDGMVRDLLLNLTGEAVGAALTVVLIGGLWARLQTDSLGALDDLQRLVERRRSTALSPDERAAFAALVELHRRTRRSGPVRRLLTAMAYTLRHRRQLHAIEDLLQDRQIRG
jgi:hypothetical protein